MAKNSFRDLQIENEAKFEKASLQVKKKVTERKDIWSLIADLIDLYVPRLISAVLGSRDLSDRSQFSNEESK